MTPLALTPPAIEPVSLSEAKDFLRILGDDEDELLGTLITAARLMIEAASGRVLRSELRLKSRRDNTFVSALIRVEFAAVPSLSLWLPKRMDETYNITHATAGVDLGTMYGRASYSKFRRFNVAVEEKAAP